MYSTAPQVPFLVLGQIDNSRFRLLMDPLSAAWVSFRFRCCTFLATLVALHFTPVSKSVSQWVVVSTSVASRLASLFAMLPVSLSEHTESQDVVVCL